MRKKEKEVEKFMKLIHTASYLAFTNLNRKCNKGLYNEILRYFKHQVKDLKAMR